MIILTKHAQEKFKILAKHKFIIEKKQVILTVENPEKIDYSRLPLLIAQRRIDDNHVLRVVYKQEESNLKIITFYPGRTNQYEK